MTRARDVAKQGGLTLITPTSVVVGSGTGSVAANGGITLTGVSSVTLNSVFSSAYDNYKIVLYTTSASTAADFFIQFRTGSTTSGTGYAWQRFNLSTTSANTYAGGGSASDTKLNVGRMEAAGASLTVDIFNPFVATETFTHSQSFDTAYHCGAAGYHNVATSYESFILYTSASTINATLRIYGYNNGA
jgi:hypothetical protein